MTSSRNAYSVEGFVSQCDAQVNVSHKVSGHGFGFGTHNCQLPKGHLGFHRIGQVTWAERQEERT
jgi:hypothetical protein